MLSTCIKNKTVNIITIMILSSGKFANEFSSD